MKATAVGSYPKIPNRPRPARLRQAIARLDRGEISREELAHVQDEGTIEAINEQAEAGLDLVTDGPVRWGGDQTYIAQRLDGFEIGGLVRYFDTNTYYRQPIVKRPVRWTSPILLRDHQVPAPHHPNPLSPPLPPCAGPPAGTLPALADTPVGLIGLDFVWGPANWDELRHASFSKGLGFGIVDARNTRMETADEIAEQVRRVCEVVLADRLHVNPSCGLEYLPRETAFEKLKTLAEGVRRAGAVAV